VASEPLVVVATTRPLHSIAAFVTDGVADARLLLEGSTSPHSFQLKPSHIKAVSDADVILWAGIGVERFIPSMLKKFAPDATAIELAVLPDATTFKSRGNGDAIGSIDYHLWTHPANAELLAHTLAAHLARLDSKNSQTYMANANAFSAALQATVKETQQILVNAQGKRYLIYHDSFQYFEKAFGLGSAIVVTPQPQVQAGAKKIRSLQAELIANDVDCMLSEEQFRSKAVDTLARDLGVKTQTVDPVAGSYKIGPSLYTDWLRQTAASFAECFK